MELRPLTAADADVFHALRLRGLEETPTAFASSLEEEREFQVSFVAGRLTPEPGRCVLGAFDGARLVGVVGLLRERHLKLAHKVLLWGMYVAPEARRAGLGRALVAEALARARAMGGVRQVYLGVNAANAPAIALYQSLGFVSFGLEPACMIVDGVALDEIHMACVVNDAIPERG